MLQKQVFLYDNNKDLITKFLRHAPQFISLSGGAPTIGLNSTGLAGGTLGQTTGLGTGTGLFGASTANTGFGTTGGLGTGLSTGVLCTLKKKSE